MSSFRGFTARMLRATASVADILEMIEATSPKDRGAQNSLWETFRTASGEVSALFAGSLGWKRSVKGFAASRLVPRAQRTYEGWRLGEWMPSEAYAEALDHTEHYNAGGRPIAIIGHTYGRPHHAIATLRKFGFGAHWLTFPSWYYPIRCAAIVATAPDFRLPDGFAYDLTDDAVRRDS